jgi:quercetin dioxygenase-like cupin family protein
MSEPLKRPKVFNLYDEAFSEVIPSTLFMKHRFGASMSAALFKFAKGMGEKAPAENHSHGEEVGLVLKGTAKVTGKDGTEYVLRPGDVIIIPEDWEHSGTFDDNEECWLFCVGCPPRLDLGPESSTTAPAGFENAKGSSDSY